MKKYISAILIILIAMTIISCGRNDEKLKIACNLPMTGAFATYGSAVQNGVLLALDDLEKSSPDIRRHVRLQKILDTNY